MRYLFANIQSSGAEELLVHSFESGIYLVEANMGNDSGYVTNSAGDNLLFHSIKEAKEAFSGVDAPMWLVEETAYDEMCGSSEYHDAPMKIPLAG